MISSSLLTNLVLYIVQDRFQLNENWLRPVLNRSLIRLVATGLVTGN